MSTAEHRHADEDFHRDQEAESDRDQLAQEITSPQPSGEPIIYLEGDERSGYHLFVIWSKWEHLSRKQRSEIILDAFEAAKMCGVGFVGIAAAKDSPFPSGSLVLPDLRGLARILA